MQFNLKRVKSNIYAFAHAWQNHSNNKYKEVLFKSFLLSLSLSIIFPFCNTVQMVNNSEAVANPLQSILWKIVFFWHGFKLVHTQQDITQTRNMKPSITNQPGNAQDPMNHHSSTNNKEHLLFYLCAVFT